MANYGYDLFIARAGEDVSFTCRVCGADCAPLQDTEDGERRRFTDHNHQVFLCPYADTFWHQQALRLVRNARETRDETVLTLRQVDLLAYFRASSPE